MYAITTCGNMYNFISCIQGTAKMSLPASVSVRTFILSCFRAPIIPEMSDEGFLALEVPSLGAAVPLGTGEEVFREEGR